MFTIVGGNMKPIDKYRELMRNKVKNHSIICDECGEREDMNPGDAHYQLLFEGKILCSGCLDIANQTLFYGKEE